MTMKFGLTAGNLGRHILRGWPMEFSFVSALMDAANPAEVYAEAA